MARSSAVVGAQASRLARDLVLAGSSSSHIPKLVYGTAWKEARTADLVHTALRLGFRGIDTAAQPKHYDERAVGEGVRRAVADGIIQRADIFIQTKFTAPGGQNHTTPYSLDAPLPEKVRQSVRSSLDNFALDGQQEAYLDSVVLHSPMDTLEETLAAWQALESFTPHAVRNLGISNASLDVVQALCERGSVKPAVVQNRFHARTGYEVAMRRFCREHDIVFQSFWTLTANGPLARSEPVQRVSRGAGVEMAAAYYALVLGLENLVVLDGTTSEEHMRQDLEGIEAVGAWAEAEGSAEWEAALGSFKSMVGDG